MEFPNHALLDEESLAWLASLPVPPLSRSQMTALVVMRNGGILTNSGYRASTGVQDSRIATRELRELVDASVVERSGTRGSTTYRLTSRTLDGSTTRNEASAVVATVETRVLGALAGGPLTRLEVELATGLSPDQVKRVFRILRAKGRIGMLGKPRARNVRWTLTPETGPEFEE